ncbi:hypothetical protein Sru01_55580 [Sphaerisporangium rufum]|uniref:Cell wall-active antibiotics response LiaF-like C-terminal domain-containing protein n=1 Tax=Sphaerisporangium rufum TaxID=1381558 RepID=A0A919V0Y7_9ACTN|nr:DUF1707 domain-containing protein [Sphaerisporangium rufum]GII80576.1 hypothetical protein Sru01_55580 [Sphaerisporangium rufum]
MRASDAEREAVVERLREASVEGRLTLAELTERTEAAYLAATHAELAQVTADLPGGPPQAYRPPAAPRTGGRARRWLVAVMGDTKRHGKWRIDGEIGAVAVMGDVTIDLREAEVRSNEIDIVATVVMGDIKIIVPDGVDVDLTGVVVMGDKSTRVIEAPPGQNVPIVRVRAYVLMGDVKVIGDSHAKPIKRDWYAWSGWWAERRAEFREDMRGMRRELRDERRGRGRYRDRRELYGAAPGGWDHGHGAWHGGEAPEHADPYRRPGPPPPAPPSPPGY